jgi:chromosome segregation protein
MQRQNLIDRVTMEHRVNNDGILNAPEPDWEEDRPETEWIETRTAELRAKLDAMGQVNLIAIEEYGELQERHTFLNEQHEDLVGARQKLVTMINKINQTTSQMFSDTFAKVNENFGSMFKKLFDGGSAKLVLVDEEDVLESGIEIIARPPGKKLQNVSLLSGGERALTAVSLLFAIYMIKPSPFCILDELDAPLDDSNIGRFINILQDFLGQSQFLVITHSQQTIAAASVIYGITMEEKGVSRLVSMKFVDAKEQNARATDKQPTALAT